MGAWQAVRSPRSSLGRELEGFFCVSPNAIVEYQHRPTEHRRYADYERFAQKKMLSVQASLPAIYTSAVLLGLESESSDALFVLGSAAALIVFVGLVISGHREEKREDAAREAARRAHEAETERLRELYPDVVVDDLYRHHKKELEREAKARHEQEFKERFELTNSAKERRALAYEMGNPFITRKEVLRRHDWICGICHKGIRRSFKFDPDDDRCGTVDHIIPLNKGGQHEWSNVQAAHWGCNQAKSDKTR